MMRVSNIVGSATGQIVDFLILSEIAGGALRKVITATSEASTASRILAEGTVARAATTSAAVGFVNGSLLTPTQSFEGIYRRLGRGIVDAGSFAAMGATGARMSSGFGVTLIERAKWSALSGIAGGATNSLMAPLSYGRLPDVRNTLMNTAGFMAKSKMENT